MSDLDRTWDEDNNIALPPTPGRTLNILPSNKASATSNRENNSKKAKRRLELEANPVLAQKKLKPFTIPKKNNKPPKDEKDQRYEQQKPPPPKKPKIEPNEGGEGQPMKTNKIKTEPHSSPSQIKPRIFIDEPKKLTPAEETILAKRLKTQAWARILKHKTKLYIPHTSDPRSQEDGEAAAEDCLVDVKPFDVADKENSSITVNVVATVMTTPVKMTDHNSIIKFMSITPQLLSPLSENPRIFQ